MMKGPNQADNNNNGGDEEILPLTTSQLIQQRSSSFSETMGVLFYDDPTDLRRPRRDVRDFFFGMVVWATGWFGPRYTLQPYLLGKNDTSQPPYQITKAGDVIVDFFLNQPLVEPATIPAYVLIACSVWLPIVVVVAVEILSVPRRPAWALAALLTIIGVTEGTTQILKLIVQRKRPNYYALCGFDDQTRTCTADASRIREAQYSFPSGHSSLSACSAVYLTWFLISKVIASRRLTLLQKRMGSAIISSVLLGWTIAVGTSRLVDQWHHPSDVLAGWLLGTLVATTVYHLYYYPLWHSQVAVPLS